MSTTHRIAITGATGVIGRRLVERFADAGHEVLGLVRDPDGAALVEGRGGIAIEGDVLEPSSLAPLLEGATVAVHAATAIPTDDKPDPAAWERNATVRVEGARNVLETAESTLDRLLVPSVVWVARQPTGEAFDETAPRHPDLATQSAADLEAVVRDESSEAIATTILRLGFLYAPDAAHTRDWGQRLLDRSLPIVGTGLLGRGETTLSMLHADDAAEAFVAALDAGCAGTYHVVEDRPVSTAALFRTFADALEAPSPRRLPSWLTRWFVGQATHRVLTISMPTHNDRFTAATNWTPNYAVLETGLEQVVEQWRETGHLEPTAAGYRWIGDTD